GIGLKNASMLALQDVNNPKLVLQYFLSASRRPDIRVTAVDKSPEALAVAITNARNLALNKRIDFRESDLFSALAGERFSLIAANLPYVSESEYLTLEPEVRCFEPECALTAPEEGFALIRQAINSCSTHLLPGGKVIFEMSPRQIPAALELLEAQNFTAKVVADQFGEQRFAFGVLG
ncbi:MAG: methyltransferase domain-containing protein, partial [Lentisphaeria bacterium]|nr:methyltransferase domain-containing protein [Lentisphaeria bacterium]